MCFFLRRLIYPTFLYKHRLENCLETIVSYKRNVYYINLLVYFVYIDGFYRITLISIIIRYYYKYFTIGYKVIGVFTNHNNLAYIYFLEKILPQIHSDEKAMHLKHPYLVREKTFSLLPLPFNTHLLSLTSTPFQCHMSIKATIICIYIFVISKL